MSLYEQVKALNKKEKKQMLDFTHESLRRTRIETRDKTEREQDALKPKSS